MGPQRITHIDGSADDCIGSLGYVEVNRRSSRAPIGYRWLDTCSARASHDGRATHEWPRRDWGHNSTAPSKREPSVVISKSTISLTPNGNSPAEIARAFSKRVVHDVTFESIDVHPAKGRTPHHRAIRAVERSRSDCIAIGRDAGGSWS